MTAVVVIVYAPAAEDAGQEARVDLDGDVLSPCELSLAVVDHGLGVVVCRSFQDPSVIGPMLMPVGV